MSTSGRLGVIASALALPSGWTNIVSADCTTNGHPTCAPTSSECSASPAVCGQWGPIVLVQPSAGGNCMQPIHTILLPNDANKPMLLCLDWEHDGSSNGAPPDVVVIDLGTNGMPIFDADPVPGHHNMFCGGHALTADGRVVIRGGGDASDQCGTSAALL